MSELYTIWNMIKPGVDIALIQSQIAPLILEQLSLADRRRCHASKGHHPGWDRSFKEVSSGLDYLKRQLLDTVKVRSN